MSHPKKNTLAVKCVHYRPQGKVMFSHASVSHSVHNQPHGYSVIAHPSYGAVDMHPTGMLSCYLFGYEDAGSRWDLWFPFSARESVRCRCHHRLRVHRQRVRHTSRQTRDHWWRTWWRHRLRFVVVQSRHSWTNFCKTQIRESKLHVNLQTLFLEWRCSSILTSLAVIMCTTLKIQYCGTGFGHYAGGFFRKGWIACLLLIRKIWTIKLFVNRGQIRLLNSTPTDLHWCYSRHNQKLKLSIRG